MPQKPRQSPSTPTKQPSPPTKKVGNRPRLKPSNRAWHRLHSIRQDVRHRVEPTVARIQDYVRRTTHQNVCIFLNERCGSWYWRPTERENGAPLPVRTHACHFKSTDGHPGSWLFSLKRLNLEVLYQAAEENCIVLILDASVTKLVPDSFSRTIPLWAAVLNQAVVFYQRQNNEGITNCSSDAFHQSPYFDLHTPPSVVPPDEHNTMQKLVEERTSELLQSHAIVDLRRLQSVRKPLTPFWVMADNIDLHDTREESLSQIAGLPTAMDLQQCYPVICINCSKQGGANHKEKLWTDDKFWYTPGAADDEESWARGLTPLLFWRHAEALLDRSAVETKAPSCVGESEDNDNNNHKSSISPTQCLENITDHRIDALVAEWKKLDHSEQQEPVGQDTLSSSLSDRVGDTLLSVGSRRAGRPPECWTAFDAVLNVTDTEYPGMHQCPEKSRGMGYYLQAPVREGKRDRTELERWMAVGVVFCVYHLQRGRTVLIHCAQGKDRSVAMALAIVVLFCELTYPLRWKESFWSFPVDDLLRSSPDGEMDPCSLSSSSSSSSGLSDAAVTNLLGYTGRDALFQAVRSHCGYCEQSQATSCDTANKALASKETIRIALHLIRQDRAVAEPTRSTMQKLHRFFMSIVNESRGS